MKTTGVIRRCVALAALASLAMGSALGQHNNAQIGYIWCADGNFWSPEEYAKAGADVKAKGIVYWVDPEGRADASRMVALKDAARKVGWSGQDNTDDVLPTAMEVGYDAKSVNNQLGIHGIMSSPWRGKENTELLRKQIAAGKEYPAAAAISDDAFAAGWYLPSIVELMMLSAQYRHVAASLEAVIKKEGDASADLMKMQMYYSSSIEAEHKGAFYLAPSGGVRADAQYDRSYANNMGVRAVRSFSTASVGSTKIGDLVSFSDGSKGVLVDIAHDGQSGWAIALKDGNTDGLRWAKTSEAKTKSLNVQIAKVQDSHKGINPKWNELDNMAFRSLEALRAVLVDLDGYGHTEAIRKAGTKEDYPAAYAIDFDKEWYLPAAGQMQSLFALEPFIKKTLEENGGSVPEGYYWTSTPQNDNVAWYLSTQCGIYDDHDEEGYKTKEYHVRAMRNWQAAKPANYTLAFDGNGATGGAMESKTLEVGKPVDLPRNAFMREGFAFLGWSKDRSAAAAEYADGRNV